MTFSRPVEGSYYKLDTGLIETNPQSIHSEPAYDAFRITPILVDNLPRMRDLKIRVKYRIVDKRQDDDWFGFMFRSTESTGKYEPVYQGSILVNARFNGRTDLTLYPGQIIPTSGVTHTAHDGQNYRVLEVTLEGGIIRIAGDKGEFEYGKLELVNFGYIYLTCFRAKVEFKDLEILCTDTISEIL